MSRRCQYSQRPPQRSGLEMRSEMTAAEGTVTDAAVVAETTSDGGCCGGGGSNGEPWA